MPDTGKIQQNVSVQSFQSFNGDNQIIAMYGVNYKPCESVSLFAGGGLDTNLKDYMGGVVDLKGNVAFNANYGVQTRVRTYAGDGKLATQVRISPYVQENVGKNVTLYVNPYYAYKADYLTPDKSNHSLGIFGGANFKVNDKTVIFAEIQRYNLQNPTDNSPRNWSANVGITYKF